MSVDWQPSDVQIHSIHDHVIMVPKAKGQVSELPYQVTFKGHSLGGFELKLAYVPKRKRQT